MDSEYKAGDTFLLFKQLNYNGLSLSHLPLKLGPNIFLDETPHSLLERASQSDLSIVAPEYPASGAYRVCMKVPKATNSAHKYEPKTLFALAITSLRLVRPLGIVIAGQFTVGSNDELTECQSYSRSSIHNPKIENYPNYDVSDTEMCATIVDRWIERDPYSGKRLRSALTLFSQVTTGWSSSYQMNYLVLFAALDALFIPNLGDKQNLLARHASKLLGSHLSGTLKTWLKKEYQEGRNRLAHGIQDVTLGSGKLTEEQPQTIGKLHEITRLSLLGFLSLDEKMLRELKDSEANALTLKDKLKALKPPSGPLMDGQQMWCE